MAQGRRSEVGSCGCHRSCPAWSRIAVCICGFSFIQSIFLISITFRFFHVSCLVRSIHRSNGLFIDLFSGQFDKSTNQFCFLSSVAFRPFDDLSADHATHCFPSFLCGHVLPLVALSVRSAVDRRLALVCLLDVSLVFRGLVVFWGRFSIDSLFNRFVFL